jgi:hypothetical protein
MSIKLNISIEAINKLTILDVEINKIDDQRKINVKNNINIYMTNFMI